MDGGEYTVADYEVLVEARPQLHLTKTVETLDGGLGVGAAIEITIKPVSCLVKARLHGICNVEERNSKGNQLTISFQWA
ncbi:hypothetical protein KIN20_007094 [Parelaphostrongylus tenuis]|uniref:Uncharacterized protein n=1 Tax=Parelaphostrongylus tenuis TaxID=148309 RepID=A0AAD5ML19_PARTN|nr:hypothetical protein KIN20_007094 [Parelaphostrongylus tenuis]